jgi:hypothetical protein
MAIAELRGEGVDELVPFHNRVRLLHPELHRFKLDKQVGCRSLARLGCWAAGLLRLGAAGVLGCWAAGVPRFF